MNSNDGLKSQFKLMDELRPEASAVIKRLQDNNLNVHLLSGSGAAADIAAQLGISQVVDGARPQDKLAYLQMLQGNAQEKAMMVGDGINDIPVLAAADVSLAMLDASDLAKTSADCILLTPSLATLPALFDKAQRTSHIIRQNLLWALLYNATAVPAASKSRINIMSLRIFSLIVGNSTKAFKTSIVGKTIDKVATTNNEFNRTISIKTIALG